MFSMSMMMSAANQAIDYTKLLLRPSNCITDETGSSVVIDKAIYFDGVDDYLSISNNGDFNFGSGNFTIDCWINQIGNAGGGAGYSYITGLRGGNAFTCSGFIWRLNDNGTLWFAATDNGSAWTISFSTLVGDAIAKNCWNHIAIVREGSAFKMYINGIMKASTSNSAIILSTTNSLAISGEWINTPTYINVYLSNFRISKGIARYTSNFTPSTEITLDSYDKLVISPINSIISDSATAKAITKVGNPTVNLAKSAHPVVAYGDVNIQPLKNISWPMYFDGTGDYLVINNHADFNFGFDDFTIDFWYKTPNTGNPYTEFISKRTTCGSGSQFDIRLFTSGLSCELTDGSTVRYAESGIANDGLWHHFAITRSSSTLRSFFDGILKGITDCNISISNTANLLIGGGPCVGVDGTVHFNGYMSNVRISKGIARWTYNFNPDTIDYTVDAYTKLYINPSNAAITDVTGKTITKNGDTKVIATPSIERCLYFDGSGDYLSVANHEDLNLSFNDWTINCWINLISNTKGYQQIVQKDGISGSNYASYEMHITSAGKLGFLLGNATGASSYQMFAGITTLSTNTWYHIAVVKTGNVLKGFVNGNQDWSSNITISIVDGGRNLLAGYQQNQDASHYLYGYISNLRISKGIARWTSNFNPTTTVTLDSYDKLYIKDDFVDLATSKTVTKYGNTKTIYNLPLAAKALQFDGTGDYLTVPSNEDWNFGSNDFTIEGWIYTSGPRNANTILHTNSGVSYLSLYADYSGVPMLSHENWGVNGLKGPSALPTGWCHLAVTRQGSSVKMYVNGTMVASRNDFSKTFSTTGLLIGNSAWNNYFLGKISNLRITKGKAIYTENFTPTNIT